MGEIALGVSCYTSGAFAYEDVLSGIDKTTAGRLTPNVLIGYTVPEILNNVTIRRVMLSYNINNPNGTNIYLTKTTISPAVFDENNISYIGYYNYSAYVTKGAGLEQTEGAYPDTIQPVSKNITSIFANNVKDGKFGLEINLGYTSNWSDSTPMEDRFLYIMMAPQITVTYDDIVPSTPIISEPNEQYVNDTDNVTFKWVYSADSPFPQYSVTIEWKVSGASDYNVVTLTQSTNSYTFPAGTFPTGTIEYRIKTTDTGGNVSGYAYAKFVVKSKPPLPIITSIDNCALTRIVWNSAEQTAYDMSLYKGDTLIYSENVNSIKKEYRPTLFLEDGDYTFRINIKNAYDLWSGETSKMFTISTSKPEKPTIQSFADGDIVNLEIKSNAYYNYVYRVVDGEETCIAVVQSGLFVDNAPVLNKINKYYVRAYDVGYTDSDIIYTRPFTEGFVLSHGNKKIAIKQSLDKFMPFNEGLNRKKYLNNYVGRKYPVREMSEFHTHTIERSCFIKSDKIQKLLELVEEDGVLLYRDDRGKKMYCDLTINGIKNELVDTGYEVEISVQQVDYEEGVSINA